MRPKQAVEAGELAKFIEAQETAEGQAMYEGIDARIRRIAALFSELGGEIGGCAQDRLRLEDLHYRGLADHV
jgi:hypothetical protein